MGTRGLIGVVEYNLKDQEEHKRDDISSGIQFVYNNFDSYPDNLMREIYGRLQKGDYVQFKKDILSGKFTGVTEKKLINIKQIDYLFHEYVYVLDFLKQRWFAFESKWKGNLELEAQSTLFAIKNNMGYLKPIGKKKGYLFHEIFDIDKVIKNYEEKQNG